METHSKLTKHYSWNKIIGSSAQSSLIAHPAIEWECIGHITMICKCHPDCGKLSEDLNAFSSVDQCLTCVPNIKSILPVKSVI